MSVGRRVRAPRIQPQPHSCRTRTRATFPAEVAGPVQFGPRLWALAVPFTNNRAERALRRANVHMKIAGCFRTRDGAEHFALLRGLVETARQRGWSLLDLLRLGPEAALPQPVPP